jgi:DNA-directed RNA polymerase subunit delta
MTNSISKTTFVDSNGVLVAAKQPFVTAKEAVKELELDEAEEEENLFGVYQIQAAKKKADDDDDDDDEDTDPDVEEKDDWEEVEEEDDWDPDFDEFDIPKSTKAGKGKKGDEEEDVKFDDDLNEFDDLFGEGGDDFDDDDDF